MFVNEDRPGWWSKEDLTLKMTTAKSVNTNSPSQNSTDMDDLHQVHLARGERVRLRCVMVIQP